MLNLARGDAFESLDWSILFLKLKSFFMIFQVMSAFTLENRLPWSVGGSVAFGSLGLELGWGLSTQEF